MTPRSDDLPAQVVRAFVAISDGPRTFVADLPRSVPTSVGRAQNADIGLTSHGVLDRHAELSVEHDRVAIRSHGPVYVNGKKADRDAVVNAGDEIAIGGARLVVGVSSNLTPGRRALSHPELVERLAEEMGRAARRGRPTCLLMLRARPGRGGDAAAFALERLRVGDAVGMWSADELELLLPETTAETAEVVVGRLLARFPEQGACAGLAVAPMDADHPERLIAKARAALLHAERLGTGEIARPFRGPTETVEPVTADLRTLALSTRIQELAVTDTPVLLSGEVSAGKGVFAHLFHAWGPHARGPLVILRSGTLMRETDARAAFDPATGVALGARGGTLILEEVCDFPLYAQERVRELLTSKKLDARVVATTHRDIRQLVERGAFDRELGALLTKVVLEVPSLRDRPADIVPLAERFAKMFGDAQTRFSASALARLRTHPWPGNVPELRNAIERAISLAGPNTEISAEHLPAEPLPTPGSDRRLREHVDSIERDAIARALAEHRQNQTRAAQKLGISRRTLIYKMEKYGLKAPPPGARLPGGR